MCRCYGMSSAYDVSCGGAGSCAMSDVYMLESIDGKTLP